METMTAEQVNKRVVVPMPEALIEEIKHFRFEERHESQADAVRELVRLGLEAWRQGPKKSERKHPTKGKAAS